MAYYVNEHIAGTERVFPLEGRYDYHRFDMNENPEGLPKDFVDSVLSEITPEFLSTYPEPSRFEAKYAAFIEAEPGNIMTTNGSDMAIRYLLETFGEPGKDVVTVSPSFEMYWVNCSLLGLHHVPVAYEDDLSIDVDKIVNAITHDTRVVVLLNPNNPVGNVYTEDDMARIVAKATDMGAVVVIDEAYHYFCSTTFLDYALTHDNVIVLRTFSKLFSIAACRLGIAIGRPQIIATLRNARLSFDANSIALLFGERLIERPELVQDLIDAQAEGKAWCIQKLQEHGYECRNCAGNFFFMKPKDDSKEVVRRLEEERKVLVRGYSRAPLAGLIRVSTGSKTAMEIFVEALLAVDGREASPQA